MNIIEALMKGDIDAISHEMQQQERERQADFMNAFRSTMSDELRPAIVLWLKDGGTHEPSCGRGKKGDLLRWQSMNVRGSVVRVPSVRVDMLDKIVDGKIEVEGMELVRWIATKLDGNTINTFISLRRSLNRPKQ